MHEHDHDDLLGSWSQRLGLAVTQLLPSTRDGHRRHFALLDGVEGSFTLSTEEVDKTAALDWTWSSQLALHVAFGEDQVLARQVAAEDAVLKFERAQVESNVERFFDVLTARRIEPAATIADHIVQCFRAHRHAAVEHQLSTDESLTTFLTIVDDIIRERRSPLDGRLPPDHRERLLEELAYNRSMRRNADLGLTMRHAAGMVFQETHAELASVPVQEPLFGLAPAPSRSTRNRLGAYYTPPGLARVLTDIALAPFLDREAIRIADPACGSGIFLSEAARSLQRLGFQGAVELIGLDLSTSAIEMARFTLEHNDAARAARVHLDTTDFLNLEQSIEADVIIMNPPFVAAPDLPASLRKKAKTALGAAHLNRPDLSMVFTTVALTHLTEGGTLATLLPAGVLGQQGGSRWRASIVEANDVDLIAVLGDHGLFKDAVVNIAALVLRNRQATPRQLPVMLWAGQRRGASSAALRRLRRWYAGEQAPERTMDWSVRRARTCRVLECSDWTPRPDSLGGLPERLRQQTNVETVGKLFNVELGIRGGRHRPRLQLASSDYATLPAQERKLFRPVADTRSIRDGRIRPKTWAFYPESALSFAEIARAAPEYFERFVRTLEAADDEIVDFARARRATNTTRPARIVSRAFLSTGSFAVDADGSHVVVQGYSWLPKHPITDSAFDTALMLADYAFVLNSMLFFRLARESCRIVAGGQVDGAKAQMAPIPLPDLPAMYMRLPGLEAHAARLRATARDVYPSTDALDEFAALAYGTHVGEWTAIW